MTSPPAPEASPLAVRLYGFRATGEAVPHPMNAAEGNWMWDALGGGCIDGGSWEDEFPGGKGDIRVEAFCIPQPCLRVLTPEELSRDVLGRKLEPGEYRTYLRRLEDACGQIPASPVNAENGLGLDDLLELASLDWVMSDKSFDGFEPDPYDAVTWAEAPDGGVEWVYPANRRQDHASIVPLRPSSGSRGSGGSGKTSTSAKPGTETPGLPDQPGTDTPDPDQPGTGTPDKPGTDKPGTDTPGTDGPGTHGPGTDAPGTDTPGTDEPDTGEPGIDNPGTDKPGTDNPGTDTPGTDEPGTDEPGTDNPDTGEPGPDPDLPEPPTFPEGPGGGLDPDQPDQPGTPGEPTTPDPAPVPVPGGLPLLLTGIAALALRRRRAA